MSTTNVPGGGFILGQITEGWSSDEKFLVEHQGEKHVLRYSNPSLGLRKTEEFRYLQNLNIRSDRIPKVIGSGFDEAVNKAWIRYQYIEGTPLEQIMDRFDSINQYRFGMEAGKVLKAIHSVEPTQSIDIFTKMTIKYRKKKNMYEESGLKEDFHEEIIAFLENNQSFLALRPSTFCHGDFHPGNMVIDPSGRLFVIDFNRWDIADPYEDFSRMISFGRRLSIPFCIGQLRGYFGVNGPSEHDFRLFLWYVSMDLAFGLLWARDFGSSEIEVHEQLKKQILGDFNHYRQVIPTWWKENEYDFEIR